MKANTRFFVGFAGGLATIFAMQSSLRGEGYGRVVSAAEAATLYGGCSCGPPATPPPCAPTSDVTSAPPGCCQGPDGETETIIAGTAGLDGGTLRCGSIGCADRTADLDDCK
jgi:hypothetical protein